MEDRKFNCTSGVSPSLASVVNPGFVSRAPEKRSESRPPSAPEAHEDGEENHPRTWGGMASHRRILLAGTAHRAHPMEGGNMSSRDDSLRIQFPGNSFTPVPTGVKRVNPAPVLPMRNTPNATSSAKLIRWKNMLLPSRLHAGLLFIWPSSIRVRTFDPLASASRIPHEPKPPFAVGLVFVSQAMVNPSGDHSYPSRPAVEKNLLAVRRNARPPVFIRRVVGQPRNLRAVVLHHEDLAVGALARGVEHYAISS